MDLVEFDDVDEGDQVDEVASASDGDGDGEVRAPRVRDRRPRRSRSLWTRWEMLDAKRAIVLALVISVVALTLAMPVRTYFAQHAEFDQLRASNDQLRSEVTDYQQKVNEQGDPAYIEAQARERLQFVRPGETPLVMMFPGDDARRAAQQRAEEYARNPWYGNLWESVANPPNAQ